MPPPRCVALMRSNHRLPSLSPCLPSFTHDLSSDARIENHTGANGSAYSLRHFLRPARVPYAREVDVDGIMPVLLEAGETLMGDAPHPIEAWTLLGKLPGTKRAER